MPASLRTRTTALALGVVVSVAAALLALAAPAQAGPLRVLTEELPPFNMTDGGEVTGMSTEVVRAVLAEAGLSARIEVMPWARAYDLALHQDNVLIYSIARTPERETRFNWVGIIAPTRWSLYSRASRGLQVDSLEAARAYQIGTVNEDAGEQYLKQKGFSLGHGLQSSIRYELGYQKLMQGHVDLWIANDLNADYIARRLGDDPEKTLRVSVPLTDISQGEGLEMAFSLGTPAETVERARAALATVRANGIYDAIARKWNAHAQ
ncbi:transporter substrate-binding domain-containing protein [Pseudomonas sp. RIT-PI-S]|uniref:substrate-binding periplasmic protein n=1 Tax=Pseudomonas sp. RIT-PI-S TaxID=3035295 RepID=UPI0021D8EF3B|nr:transporter substrate-binding domain-containing protein [Pseudomonas sp. RIT-PI-S]